MIIQTGMRTDIPAFYSQWLLNRIEALLLDGSLPGDMVHQATQTSWLDPQLRWNFERGSRMKHKILETKNQVKLQLYEAYLTRQAIPYKKRYTPMSGGYCLYVDKANLSLIDGKEALGDLYGSVEKSYFGITDCPNEKK